MRFCLDVRTIACATLSSFCRAAGFSSCPPAVGFSLGLDWRDPLALGIIAFIFQRPCCGYNGNKHDRRARRKTRPCLLVMFRFGLTP
jgi:hypothetical protein